jgi:hypothetical protein
MLSLLSISWHSADVFGIHENEKHIREVLVTEEFRWNFPTNNLIVFTLQAWKSSPTSR